MLKNTDVEMKDQTTLDSFDMTPTLQIPDRVESSIPSKKPSSRDESKFVKIMMYGLTAPFVFSAGGWGETFPEDLLQRGRMLRLAHSIKCIDEEKCTIFDAMAYMYSASFEAPLSHEWMKIYLYTYKIAVPEKFEILKSDDTYAERDSELDQNEMYDLDRLRNWIFKRQIQSIK